jgi:hypothetical protein
MASQTLQAVSKKIKIHYANSAAISTAENNGK